MFENPCEDTIGSIRRTRSTLAGIIQKVSNFAANQLQNDLPAQVRENLVAPPLPATCAGHVIGEHCLPGTIPRIGWHSTTLDPRTDYVKVPGFQDLTMKVNKPVDKVQEGVFATCHSFQYALERLYRKQKTVNVRAFVIGVLHQKDHHKQFVPLQGGHMYDLISEQPVSFGWKTKGSVLITVDPNTHEPEILWCNNQEY